MFENNQSNPNEYLEIKRSLNEIIENLKDLFEQLKELNLTIEFSYSEKDHILFKEKLADYYDLKVEIKEYFMRFPILVDQIKAKSLGRILKEKIEEDITIIDTFNTLKNECENIFQEIESYK